MDELVTRRVGDEDLWTVERIRPFYRSLDYDLVLAVNFGATPVFAPTPQAAMCIAQFCEHAVPLFGLRWVAVYPEDIPSAIDFAQQRAIKERLDQRFGSIQ